MYENRFSLANINQIVKAGGSSALQSRNRDQKGGLLEKILPRKINPNSNLNEILTIKDSANEQQKRAETAITTIKMKGIPDEIQKNFNDIQTSIDNILTQEDTIRKNITNDNVVNNAIAEARQELIKITTITDSLFNYINADEELRELLPKGQSKSNSFKSKLSQFGNEAYYTAMKGKRIIQEKLNTDPNSIQLTPKDTIDMERDINEGKKLGSQNQIYIEKLRAIIDKLPEEAEQPEESEEQRKDNEITGGEPKKTRKKLKEETDELETAIKTANAKLETLNEEFNTAFKEDDTKKILAIEKEIKTQTDLIKSQQSDLKKLENDIAGKSSLLSTTKDFFTNMLKGKPKEEGVPASPGKKQDFFSQATTGFKNAASNIFPIGKRNGDANGEGSSSTDSSDGQKGVTGDGTSENVMWNKIKEKFILLIEKIMEDFSPKKWKEGNRPSLWAFLAIFALLMLIGGMVLSMYILIMVNVKHRRAMNIKLESRYNRDLPEYLIARSATLSSRELPFNMLITMPLLAILSVIAIVAHKFYKGKSLGTSDNTCPVKSVGGTDGDDNSTGNGSGTGTSTVTGNMIPLPFGLMFIIFVFCGISVSMVAPTYLSTRNQLKAIRNKIQTFENYIFNNIYIDQKFLTILYNEGKPTENIDDLIKRAISTVMVNVDGKVNKNINSQDVIKMIYTLRMYEFLYDDLRDVEILNTNYRTDSLELFNYKLLALPGNSRIFRIADYMRTNKAPEMIDNAKLMNTIRKVNKFYSIKDGSTMINDINKLLYTTHDRSFNLKAGKAWKPVRTLSIVSFVAHWFIILCVLAYIFGKIIVKKFLGGGV